MLFISLFIMMLPTYIHPTQMSETTTREGYNHTIAKQSAGAGLTQISLSNKYTQLQFAVYFSV